MRIVVDEIVRCGDVILLRFHCPRCAEPQMGSWEWEKCGSCGDAIPDRHFDLSQTNWRIVCGSLRKTRGRIGKKVIAALYRMQERMCAYCSTSLEAIEYHVEHILPLAAGGTNKVNNLCLACPTCNHLAAALAFPDFVSKQNYILAKNKL